MAVRISLVRLSIKQGILWTSLCGGELIKVAVLVGDLVGDVYAVGFDVLL